MDSTYIILSSTVVVPQSALYRNRHHYDEKQEQNMKQIINRPLRREEAPATGSSITHLSLLHVLYQPLNTV